MLDDRLNHLKVKLEAVESVHAFLLGMIVQLLPIERNTVLTELTKNIIVKASIENDSLLAEQCAQDAIDKIETAIEKLS